ncbi:MAG: HNH endonuclease signature motif containing protein [bacterium]|nr:HNH endonuclease signature motif containing protein [bacterium]
MSSYVPAELRRRVVERARGCCEYCRFAVDDRLLPGEIDHVISEKHGGKTVDDNLCLACFRCNSLKGSDIAGADPVTGLPTFLYHPRLHLWSAHFRFMGEGHLEPLSPEARLTVLLLKMNAPVLIVQRRLLHIVGRYPCL